MHPDSALADVYISLKSESIRSPSHGATTYTAHDCKDAHLACLAGSGGENLHDLRSVSTAIPPQIRCF